MKNFTLFLAAILLSIASLAQSPGGINYQTVIRDGSGNELANVSLSLKMSIRNGAPNGDVIYVETHEVTSNSWGLVNLIVGNGTVQSGDFSDINWGIGEKYLETAIDTDGSGNYTVLGVTQFLSVPYSLHASNGNYSMTTEERDALVDPPLGMQIFNITTNCLNYFNGYGWYETCGDCTPMPSPSNAGPDQYFADATTATTLDANTPEYGNGIWSVSSGSGGSFEDVNDPNTLFTGEACQVYDLKWTITSTCGATEDLVSIEFDTPPTVANAGADQTYNDATVSVNLEGNNPEVGTGMWSIEIGNGGSFIDVNDPTTLFTGNPCETYTLKWTVANACGSSEDFVEIIFNTPPTTADAGPDQTFNDATISTNLEANTPILGVGLWTVETGNGGSFDAVNDPATLFTGEPCESYTIKWTIENPCGFSKDLVEIIFNTPPTTADAGQDQTFNDATIATNLEANTPILGVGLWTVETGNGGSFDAVNDPATLFTGAPCETYTLKWTITNPCGSSEDMVNIVFNTPPTTADAGPDQLDVQGTSTALAGNSPVIGTGLWSILSGTGGNISEPLNPVSIFTGAEGVTYEVQWTIANNCGSSTDNVLISFAGGGGDWTCGDLFTDTRDGQTYETVLIGDQCWMAGNLNIGTRLDVNIAQTDNNTIEKHCYDNNETNCDHYGGLYQWDEMMQYITAEGSQGICPDGWKLPANVDWAALSNHLNGVSVAGGKLKSTRTFPDPHPRWDSPNTGATNSYGFSGFPGGYSFNENFQSLGTGGYWWTSTEDNTSYNSWYFFVYSYSATLNTNSNLKSLGLSVRCILNEQQVNQAPVTPYNPNPEDGASNQSIEGTSLSWTCTDPESDPLNYDVYFGTENPPTQVSAGQSETSYNPGTLQNTTQYFWKIVAHDDQGNTTEGAVWSFTTEEEPTAFACGDVFTDSRDGNTYETVLIGDQCWMAENLAYLPEVSPSTISSTTDPVYYVYGYQGTDVVAAKATINYQTIGTLYNWPAVMNGEAGSGNVPSGVQGVCPTGWHVPSDEEFKILEGETDTQYDYPDPEWDQLLRRGFDVGLHLKEQGTTHWASPNTGATNSSGFTALPTGMKSSNIFIYPLIGFFWTCTEDGGAFFRYLEPNRGDILRSNNYPTSNGLPVRCLKSDFTPSNPATK